MPNVGYSKQLSPVPMRGAALVSYPKSGRTWLRIMLDSLRVGLRYTHDRSHYHLGIHKDPPTGDKSEYSDDKVILLVRDPRDVIVSAYHHVVFRDGLWRGTFAEFLHSRQFGFDALLRWHQRWMEARDVPADFLKIRYEDMHADSAQVLLNVVQFLGRDDEVNTDQVHLSRALRKGSFDTMHRLEATDWRNRPRWFKNYGRMLIPSNVKDFNTFKTRIGRVGTWEEYMGRAEKSYCASRMSRVKVVYWEA